MVVAVSPAPPRRGGRLRCRDLDPTTDQPHPPSDRRRAHSPAQRGRGRGSRRPPAGLRVLSEATDFVEKSGGRRAQDTSRCPDRYAGMRLASGTGRKWPLLGRKQKPIATTPLDRGRTETHVKPRIGSTAVRGLRVAHPETFQARILAGQTRGTLHAIFEQAARWDAIDSNPARGVRKIINDTKAGPRIPPQEMTAPGRVMPEATDERSIIVAAERLMPPDPAVCISRS